MPEMRFAVRWPDGSESEHYSPSLVVAEHLEAGASYPVTEFLDRARTALSIASARVEARYGHPCSLARRSVHQLEEISRSVPEGSVAVLRLSRPDQDGPDQKQEDPA